jgi:CRISPR-associated protein Csy3
MSKKIEELATPTVLAFERKINPSDAIMMSSSSNARTVSEPIKIKEKTVRGTISNRMKTKDLDPAKIDAKIENANIQTVDSAALGIDYDALAVTFTMIISGDIGVPSACNNMAYRRKLAAVVAEYQEKFEFVELAQRYTYNIANGRWLWRNRTVANNVAVEINFNCDDGGYHEIGPFPSFYMPLSRFDFDMHGKSLEQLTELMTDCFTGEKKGVFTITGFADIGKGQEVFPSQEMILKKSKRDKSKVLYAVGGNAAMHSQKIGNAIRTIDDWHPFAEEIGPIAVDPYGSVTSLGKACRRPTDKIDFYSLLDNWIVKDIIPTAEQQHFVIANLIRGGVYGKSAAGDD